MQVPYLTDFFPTWLLAEKVHTTFCCFVCQRQQKKGALVHAEFPLHLRPHKAGVDFVVVEGIQLSPLKAF